MRLSLAVALCSLSSALLALAKPLAARDIWDPTILTPNKKTRWIAGGTETVTWETSNQPASVSNAGLVTIAGGPALTAEFNLVQQDGSIQVTVPSNITAGVYQIILFGDSGNISPKFHICTKTGDRKHLDCGKK
ncbi:hypothetical protein AX14_008542 [Amanita brunnescens Koide BX004]|nr:hypothetical protein AX14_008542 [Amanita brunnescens Koide BX004]